MSKISSHTWGELMSRSEDTNCVDPAPPIRLGESHQPKNLAQFFRQSPMVGVDLDLGRDCDPERDIELNPGTPDD